MMIIALSAGARNDVTFSDCRIKSACGKISPNMTTSSVLITPAKTLSNRCSSNSERAETTPTLTNRILTKLRWLFLRSGSTIFARLLPSLAFRFRSATSRDISDRFSPEQIADTPIRINVRTRRDRLLMFAISISKL